VPRSILKKKKSKQPPERRVYRRALVNMWVREEIGDYYFLYKAIDISEGGIFLEKKIAKPNDQTHSVLKFTLPKSSRLITVGGTIAFTNVSTELRPPGSGVKFINLSLQDKKLILKYINQLH